MFRFTLLILSLSAMAVAENPRATIVDLQEELSLTAIQVAAVQEARENLREDAQPILRELRAAERQLRRQQAANNPDVETIAMLQTQISNAKGLLGLHRSQALAYARSILTPDQITQLAQISSSDQPNGLAMLAVQYNLIERPEAPAAFSARPRANQGDFRSDGQRR